MDTQSDVPLPDTKAEMIPATDPDQGSKVLALAPADNEILRQRINKEARDQLARVSETEARPKSFIRRLGRHGFRIGVWLVVLATIGVVWLIVLQSSQSKNTPALTTDLTSRQAKAFASTPTPAPSDQPTARLVLATATAQAVEKLVASEPYQSYYPLVQSGYPFCNDIREIAYEILSGPELSPPAGTVVEDQPTAPGQITWLLKNTSGCAWVDISIWAIQSGSIKSTYLTKPGVANADLEQAQTVTYLAPGSQLKITLVIAAEKTASLEAEWVLQVNDLFAFPAPHLVVQVKDWIRPREAKVVYPTANYPDQQTILRTPYPTSLPTLSTGATGSRPTVTPASNRP